MTSVRFFLALGVVLFHYQLQWPWDVWPVTGLLNRARLGVDVFFILSGFVLTHAYRDALNEGRLDYRAFLIARIARIYPAHLAVLAFVLIMVITGALLNTRFDHTLYSVPGLFATLFLVHAWLPGGINTAWNGPSWSLSAEWFAYLSFPVFAWIGLKLRRRPGMLLALTGALFIGLDQFYQAAFGDILVHAEARMGILRIIPEFLYGVALYRLGEGLRPSRAIAVGMAWTTTTLLLLAHMHFKADDRIVVAMAGPMILMLGLLSKVSAEGVLAKPALRLGGEASYALYLVHMPILIGWKGIRSMIDGRDSSYTLAGWEAGGLIALSLAVAVALHLHLEGPARSWIRRRVGSASIKAA